MKKQDADDFMEKTRSRWYTAQTIMDEDYADDIALLENTQAESLLHSLEQTAGGIGLHENLDKPEYVSVNQRGDISALNGCSLKLVDEFTYLGSSISSMENDINPRLAEAWSTIDRLSAIWKSDLSDEIKRIFPSSGCVHTTIWMHYIDDD